MSGGTKDPATQAGYPYPVEVMRKTVTVEGGL